MEYSYLDTIDFCHLSVILFTSSSLMFSQTLEVDIAPIYSLAPDWPALTSSTPGGLEEVITRLKAHLRKRLQSRERLEKSFWDKGEYGKVEGERELEINR